MTARLVDLGVGAVAFGVAASVVVALAGSAWHGLDTAAAQAAVAPPPPLDLSPITRFAPFGTAAASVAGDPTALGLELRGVMLAASQAESTALVAAAGGVPRAYPVGATLPGGAVLDSVEFDLIVLRVDGRLETLAFAARPRSEAGAAAATPDDATFDDAPGDGGGLLDTLGVAATPDGYRVGAASDDIRRAGLQPGDIVEKVDGQAVGDPARDRAAYNAAVVAGKARFDVVRDGRRVALTVPLP